MKYVAVLIPADWRERLDKIRKTRSKQARKSIGVGEITRTAIKDFLIRNSPAGSAPLSEPGTVGRPSTGKDPHASTLEETD